VALQTERSGGQSIVAYGDREDFCRFCALCLPEGKAQGAEPAKENRTEALPLHERDF